MCCGNEAGSCLRLIDTCTTQPKAQGPSRTCNESKEEDTLGFGRVVLDDRVAQDLAEVRVGVALDVLGLVQERALVRVPLRHHRLQGWVFLMSEVPRGGVSYERGTPVIL